MSNDQELSASLSRIEKNTANILNAMFIFGLVVFSVAVGAIIYMNSKLTNVVNDINRVTTILNEDIPNTLDRLEKSMDLADNEIKKIREDFKKVQTELNKTLKDATRDSVKGLLDGIRN